MFQGDVFFGCLKSRSSAAAGVFTLVCISRQVATIFAHRPPFRDSCSQGPGLVKSPEGETGANSFMYCEARDVALQLHGSEIGL